MQETQYLSPEEVATRLGVKVGTLAAWRCRGEGPPFHRFGAVIRYDRNDLEAWAEARRVATEPPTPQPVRQTLQPPAIMPAWLKATRNKSQISGG